MVSRKKILVETYLSGNDWTPGTAATLHQAGLLASSSQSDVYLQTVNSPDADSSLEDPELAYSLLQKLHLEAKQSLNELGVEMTSPLLQGEKSNGGTGQPAPLAFVFLSLPELIDHSNGEHRNQVLEECRNDVWLASPQAFDRDIPCFVVYDDLTFHGEQALRAAVSVAQQFQARLLVVHAVPTGNVDGLKSEIEAAMQSRLFGTDFRTLDQGTRLFVSSGSVTEVLKRAVEEFEASLMIFSWPHGPVSNSSMPELMKTADLLHCSMLLIRTPDSILRMASA